MSRRDRWKSANEMGIDTWRHARRLGRTAAERIALFNVAMERRERHGARALRANAKRRGTFIKGDDVASTELAPVVFLHLDAERAGAGSAVVGRDGGKHAGLVDAGPAPPDLVRVQASAGQQRLAGLRIGVVLQLVGLGVADQAASSVLVLQRPRVGQLVRDREPRVDVGSAGIASATTSKPLPSILSST
jgi:hypothetical protein